MQILQNSKEAVPKFTFGYGLGTNTSFYLLIRLWLLCQKQKPILMVGAAKAL